jgi:periplasmic protein TonB
VFDEVTKQEGGRNAVRRFGYVFGSTIFQVVLVFAVITASAAIKAKMKVSDDQPVDVKFVKAVAPPPPPPPAPAPVRKRPPSEKPKTDLPPPPPPQALLQPREVQAEMKPPDPNEPPEPEYDYGDQAAGEGVIGGVAGARQNDIEDAPQFATAGYRKPVMATPKCVEQTVRVPPSLQGYISGPITVKFAIKKDGLPAQFQVMTAVPDKRIGDAIWNAVQACKWIPGADSQGRPIAIWVILPIRFASQ